MRKDVKNHVVRVNKQAYHQLASDLTMCKILNGMWQVAGGHGYIDHELAVADMVKYHDAGFTTWDLADIYGPAEDLIGEFMRKLSTLKGKEELNKTQAFTKWVPEPARITPSTVNESIEKSLRRMNVNSLDLLQFHWWDYNNPYYMDDLRVISNQVQYSIIDRRPEVKMTPLCMKENISLLSYGTLCGGLISEHYLGKTQPSAAELDTLSLRKYMRMIEAWGGWNLFQELLSVLKKIAQKHNVNIANVATRYILDKPAVAGVIIGVRLGIIEHRNSNAQVFNFSLDKSDVNDIDTICTKSRNLFEAIGDCGDEYR